MSSGLIVEVEAQVGTFELTADVRLGGGLTVVFGPSGAGKTRLLRLIAGLDTPRSGRIVLDDTVFTDRASGTSLPVHERRIGMVFQRPYLLPHRTVLANVALGVRAGTREARRQTASDWLEQVDATAFSDRRPSQLSGGQQQRVALARALAGDPRLLLLDEPFNALEIPVRRQLRTLVRDLVERTGVPTVFVTHDPEEVGALADRVLQAHHGTMTDVVSVAEALRGLDPTG